MPNSENSRSPFGGNSAKARDLEKVKHKAVNRHVATLVNDMLSDDAKECMKDETFSTFGSFSSWSRAAG